MRRRKHPLDYCWLHRGEVQRKFIRGSVLHINNYDPKQEVYGLPTYLSAMDHAMLSKSSTLFRRKYIDNGGHMGFILYLNSPEMDDQAVEDIEDAIYDSSGDVGNLVIHDPSKDNGKIELIKVSDISTKDDFWNIQGITKEAVMAVHRVPEALMGMPPPKGTTSASPADVSKVFARNEIVYLQGKLQKINVMAGTEVLKFHPYAIEDSDKAE